MSGQAAEATKERIREASDIVEVVGSYVTLRPAGREFKALCPFHNEKTPSFHVVPEKRIFHCFGCNVSGDVFKFIQLHESVGFPEALRILADRAGIRLEAMTGRDGGSDQRAQIEAANRWAAGWFRKQYAEPSGDPARLYVKSRGISPESATLYGIGFAPDRWTGLLSAAENRASPVPPWSRRASSSYATMARSTTPSGTG